jgi:hypothetical protein
MMFKRLDRIQDIILISSACWLVLLSGINYIKGPELNQDKCISLISEDKCVSKCGCYWCPYSTGVGACYSKSNREYCTVGVLPKIEDKECVESNIKNLDWFLTCILILLVYVALVVHRNVEKGTVLSLILLLFMLIVISCLVMKLIFILV